GLAPSEPLVEPLSGGSYNGRPLRAALRRLPSSVPSVLNLRNLRTTDDRSSPSRLEPDVSLRSLRSGTFGTFEITLEPPPVTTSATGGSTGGRPSGVGGPLVIT